MRNIISLFILILIVQFKAPILLPNNSAYSTIEYSFSQKTKIIKLEKWKWIEPPLRHSEPNHLRFKWNGKIVKVPFENIAVFWEE